MTIFNGSYWQWSVVVKSSTRTSMEDRLSRVRTNHRPLEQVHKRNLMQAPHGFKECYCVYNPMTASLNVFQEEKWLQLTPYEALGQRESKQ